MVTCSLNYVIECKDNSHTAIMSKLPGHALARIGSMMSDRQLDIVETNITDAVMELEVSRLIPSWYQEWIPPIFLTW